MSCIFLSVCLVVVLSIIIILDNAVLRCAR